MKKIFLLFPLLLFLTSCFESDPAHYENAEAFVMRTDLISPNQEFRIVEYQFDHGAHGYSRMFWAIVPASKENINLKEYILPDGYKTLGWTSDNRAVIEKWEPYYYKDKDVTLKTGDQFNGVILELNN